MTLDKFERARRLIEGIERLEAQDRVLRGDGLSVSVGSSEGQFYLTDAHGLHDVVDTIRSYVGSCIDGMRADLEEL